VADHFSTHGVVYQSNSLSAHTLYCMASFTAQSDRMFIHIHRL